MMKKFKQRLLSLFLSVALIAGIGMTAPVSASSDPARIYAHVQEALPVLLQSAGIYGIATVSEPVPVTFLEGASEAYLVFVIQDKLIVGTLTVGFSGGEFYSTLSQSNLNQLNSVFKSQTPITLVNTNENLIMLAEDKQAVLYDSGRSYSKTQISAARRTSGSVITENTSISITAILTRNSTKQLNVPIKPNMSVNGKGICWAACVASVVQYRKGTTLYAKGVFDDLELIYGATPSGIPTWINRGFSLYSVSVTQTASRSAGAVYSSLNSGRPVMIDVFPNSGVGHSVVIAGVTYNSSGGTYTIMDPNEPSYVYSYINPSAVNNGSFYSYTSPGGSTYNNWNNSYY